MCRKPLEFHLSLPLRPGTLLRVPSPMDSQLLLFLFLTSFLCFASISHGTGSFKVQRKFPRRPSSLGDLKAHDNRRHGRILSAVDLPLGGLWYPYDAGLYYAEIGIGTPPKNYYVQVDTGSDIMWVNCIECKRCPRKSILGIELKLYDPKGSDSARLVTCDQPFCYATYGSYADDCTSDVPCQYRVVYGDGSSTIGYFVTDNVQYNQVSGNNQTKPSNATVTFGCGAIQSGDLGTSSQLDGILGFGQSNSSLISQLAASRKVRKKFAHCLDGESGGGIFAIGHIVQPKVSTTPLVPNQPHYNVNLKAIEVGKEALQLPTDMFETSDSKGTIIDSGTTLAYLPDAVYKPLMREIFSSLPNVSFRTIQNFLCFRHSGSVDKTFPVVTFHFENLLTLAVYPHDYLFEIEDQIDTICVGWQNSGGQSKDGKDMVLLGDLALSNKLVLYDLENAAIGWTEYNCSTSIKVQDDKTGAVYTISAHNISSAFRSGLARFIVSLLLTSVINYLIV